MLAIWQYGIGVGRGGKFGRVEPRRHPRQRRPTELATHRSDARFRGQSGRDVLVLSLSAFDPGCVKNVESSKTTKIVFLRSIEMDRA